MITLILRIQDQNWRVKLMARQTLGVAAKYAGKVKKVTSIGNSVRTSIKNKNKRRMTKKYRGQGR